MILGEVNPAFSMEISIIPITGLQPKIMRFKPDIFFFISKRERCVGLGQFLQRKKRRGNVITFPTDLKGC